MPTPSPKTQNSTPPTIHSPMGELLSFYPSARRTLFRLHHLGGCNSCGFSLEETLEQLCHRNDGMEAPIVLKEIEEGHLEDEKLLIDPLELRERLYDPLDKTVRLLDLRTREEFEAVNIPTSQLLTEQLMQSAMATDRANIASTGPIFQY